MQLRASESVLEHAQWRVNTESKLVDLFVCGHYWRKLPSQGSLYVLACVGQNKEKYTKSIEWMSMARQLPNFRTHVGVELN